MEAISNEIMYMKYVKQVMKYGIPRPDAKEIVESAMFAGRGRSVEMYISYAISLKYGLKLKEERVTI